MTIHLNEYLKQFNGETHHYANASHAFYDVMIWLQKNRPKKKPNILMPVYIPAKLYRFVLAAGYEPKFYDVSTDLDFDLNEVEGLIDDQTQAVFAVHFFGVPVDMAPLKEITEQAGVYLIEDCAHILNSTYKGKLLGTDGDCTLFSTRKMLQLFCGGVLVLNNKPWDFKPTRNKRLCSPFTIYRYAGSRVKYTIDNLLKERSPFRMSEIPYDGYIDFSEEHSVQIKKMDFFSRWYNNIPDLDRMAEKRREKFLYLLNGISDPDSFHPIGVERYATKENAGQYSLNTGFVPFCMPILTPPGARDRVQQAICDAGVLCFTGWPEAPFGLKGFKGADTLNERLLELPVHQFINSHHLDIIVDCLNSMPVKVKKTQKETIAST